MPTDTRISVLPDGGALQPGDELVVARSGSNYRIAGANVGVLSAILAGNPDAGAHKITGLADPTAAQDAATKNYVDSLFGLKPFINVLDAPYNAKPSAYYTDGSATGASATFASATANFTAADVGKTIAILRAGPSAHQDHFTTISAVAPDGLSCTLTNAAGRTQANARFYIARNGDQTAAIQSAIDAAAAAGHGGWVWLPGWFLTSGLVLKNGVELHGPGILSSCAYLIANANCPVVMNDCTLNNSAMGVAVEGMRLDGNRQRQSNITTTVAAGSTYNAGNTTMDVTSAANLLPAGGMITVGTNRILYTGISTGGGTGGSDRLTGVSGGQEGTTDATAVAGTTVTQIKAVGLYYGVNPYSTEPTIADFYDPHNRVTNVHIKNTKGDSVQIWGQSEARIDNVWSHYTDEIGFRLSFDTWCTSSTADTPGRMGAYVRFAEAKLETFKAFAAGGVVTADGWGVWFQGTGTEEGTSRATLDIQDCKAGGVMFWNASRRMVDATCSSNSTSGAGSFSAVHFRNASLQNDLNLISTDRTAANQLHALFMDSTCTGNKVRGTHGGANGIALGSPVDPAGDISGGNDISFNGQGGQIAQAFTATPTPDPYVATTYRMTLTGNVTAVNAPANAHRGQILRFIFQQDGTGGRTLPAFSAIYKMPAVSNTSNTASKYWTAEFEYDGTNWICMTIQQWAF